MKCLSNQEIASNPFFTKTLHAEQHIGDSEKTQVSLNRNKLTEPGSELAAFSIDRLEFERMREPRSKYWFFL